MERFVSDSFDPVGCGEAVSTKAPHCLRTRRARAPARVRMEDTDALLRARARPSLNDLYDEIGYGPFHFRLALAGALGNAADALEVALLTFLSPCAKAAFGVDGALESTLLSVVFAGEFAGAIFWGALADRVGRRVAYFWAMVTVCVPGLLSACAPDFATLLALRACVGFGVGGSVVPFDLMAEVFPRARRGWWIQLCSASWGVATLYVAGLAGWLLRSTADGDDAEAAGGRVAWLGVGRRGARSSRARRSRACALAGLAWVPEALWLVSVGDADGAVVSCAAPRSSARPPRSRAWPPRASGSPPAPPAAAKKARTAATATRTRAVRALLAERAPPRADSARAVGRRGSVLCACHARRAPRARAAARVVVAVASPASRSPSAAATAVFAPAPRAQTG